MKKKRRIELLQEEVARLTRARMPITAIPIGNDTYLLSDRGVGFPVTPTGGDVNIIGGDITLPAVTGDEITAIAIKVVRTKDVPQTWMPWFGGVDFDKDVIKIRVTEDGRIESLQPDYGGWASMHDDPSMHDNDAP